ncbi:DMT family transporter [Victivallis vadensis]|uniref:Drug/metabolite transporter (DMT)-like permease n=1 Tax=Victivallis vadensis TaxID=172901 RepID=A0A2U1AJR0_9BACT|nr:DMT family transporter [Victivallis vadensis]PVY36625.1 drug/metabolite transporter (DMT)-like permease [Victivallis vadensis]
MTFSRNAAGHLAALLTILIWGTTFISTKVLLRSFSPVEILFIRFTIGYLSLLAFFPKFLPFRELRHELYYAGAGLSGVTLYFLVENIALTHTLASNVGIMVSAAPLFTALLAWLWLKRKRPGGRFFLGFGAAIAGIALIVFNGNTVLKLNPLGDLLAILAALIWAVYSILTKLIAGFNLNMVLCTRRIFFYGWLFMIPALFLFGFQPETARCFEWLNLFNLLFLGFGATALCFAVWNWTVKVLGPVETSLYIYLVPVVTVLSSALILRERLTPAAIAGTILTLAGLLISEERLRLPGIRTWRSLLKKQTTRPE